MPTQLTVEVSRSEGHFVHRAKTPVTVTLSKRKKYFEGEDSTIKLMRDGKVVGQTELKSQLDKWYLANLIHRGTLGMLVVDPITGAIWTMDEEVFVAENLSTGSKGAQTLQITTLDDVSEEIPTSLVQID